MRTIGVYIIALILLPSFQLQKTMMNKNNPDGRQVNVFHFQISPGKYPSFITETKKKADIDTNDIKQSGWYAGAIKSIRETEYEIKPTDKRNEFASPNRQQNLRAFYSADKFTVEPRADDKWNLELILKGVYAGKKKIYSPQKDAIAVTEKNKIQFNHNNEFVVEYVNGTEGIRQNFIIQKEPDSKPQTLNIKLSTNSNWFINKVHPKEIHFAKANGNNMEKKLTYNDLKVWDATNKELDAFFSVVKNEVSINVNTTGSVYPITIDPLSTGTTGTPDWIGDDADQAGAIFGYSVASAGDVNGDGHSDVIIGAQYYDDGVNSDEGRAFVYHGSATGLSATPNSAPDDADQAGANFGNSVASAADINRDGYSDVIIGAYRYDDAGNTDEGRVFVYHGSATGLSSTPDNTPDDADQAGANFGFSVATAGDVNGDGFSDVIIGAASYDEVASTGEGWAFVYYGSFGGLSVSPNTILDDADQADANFGYSVASAGDVNGDGYSDVIIGAPFYDDGSNTQEGRAFVYHGSGSGLSTTPNSTLDDADEFFANFGVSVASAGDVNADGYSDVVIGAPLYDDGVNLTEGRAFVYYGSSTGLPATPNNTPDDADQAGAAFGESVASAGDVNGDGYSDVIIGAIGYDDGANGQEGRAFVYYGSASGLSVTPNSTPDDADLSDATFGIVASAGDVNGDGYSDVIIGAWGYNDGANISEGWAYLYHGGPDGLSASPVNMPDDADQADANFGVSVASAGDINADGYGDIIIGAWLYDDGGNSNEGVAFVYHGSATGLGATPNTMLDDANQTFALFGETVASAGDVNGDGYSDVIIGADGYDDAPYSDEGRTFVYHGSATGLSASPNWIGDDADQAGASFGVSMTSAGDVNGDGYGDVIVGAIGYLDSGNANEGRAFVYYGSATGLSASPNWIGDDADQPNAWFGWSVAGAGDINGDGYSDVIIGALTYDDSGNADEGRAFVYHGSAIGLSATPNSTPDDADQPGAQFGECVAGAGDVNGDGYSDVIIGAKLYDDGFADEGRAFVYYGSSTGLSATPNSTPDDANQASAHFGISVASAGDVNGDGYSDVIIGARYFDDGFADEGRAFVYYGSSTGLSAAPNSTPDDADQASATFGYSVAGAGDINGDGYSDVIIGAFLYDGGTSNEGQAFVYYGNNTGGLRNNLRLYNSDLVTPIQQSNMSDPNLFGAGLFAKSFIGKQKGKLVWETVKNGNPFSGTPITNSTAYTAQQATLTDLGLTGVELKNQIAKQNPAKATYIRTRVKYDLVTAITGQVYGPWRYPEGFLRGRRDIGAVALPVKFISFIAVKEDKSAWLKWITADEEPGVQFEVQHSKDGINFTTLISINGRNQTRNEYEWLHINPAIGKNFYRIRAVENQKEAYTATRKLNFSEAASIIIYPNPATPGQLLIIKNVPITADQQVKISFINATGQLVWQKEILAINGSAALNMPDIPAGAYLLLVKAGKWSDSKKIIVAGR